MATILYSISLCLCLVTYMCHGGVLSRPVTDTDAAPDQNESMKDQLTLQDLLLLRELPDLNDEDLLNLGQFPLQAEEHETIDTNELPSALKRSNEVVRRRYPMADFTSMASQLKDQEAKMQFAKHLASRMGSSSPCMETMITRVRTAQDLIAALGICS